MRESPGNLTIDVPLVPLRVFCRKLRPQTLPGRPPKTKRDSDPLCRRFPAENVSHDLIDHFNPPPVQIHTPN
jgi:hypothetical protein